MYDFNSWIDVYEETSEKVKESKADNTMKLLSDYYYEVKEILIKNRNVLDKLANELNSKKILFQDEIKKVINN